VRFESTAASRLLTAGHSTSGPEVGQRARLTDHAAEVEQVEPFEVIEEVLQRRKPGVYVPLNHGLKAAVPGADDVIWIESVGLHDRLSRGAERERGWLIVVREEGFASGLDALAYDGERLLVLVVVGDQATDPTVDLGQEPVGLRLPQTRDTRCITRGSLWSVCRCRWTRRL